MERMVVLVSLGHFDDSRFFAFFAKSCLKTCIAAPSSEYPEICWFNLFPDFYKCQTLSSVHADSLALVALGTNILLAKLIKHERSNILTST